MSVPFFTRRVGHQVGLAPLIVRRRHDIAQRIGHRGPVAVGVVAVRRRQVGRRAGIVIDFRQLLVRIINIDRLLHRTARRILLVGDQVPVDIVRFLLHFSIRADSMSRRDTAHGSPNRLECHSGFVRALGISKRGLDLLRLLPSLDLPALGAM